MPSRPLKKKMPKESFEAIAQQTDELLERRLSKVKALIDAKSTDVNLNPFLMLALAPAYNIFSPFEAAEYVQHSKLHHGDATAFGRYVEDKILPRVRRRASEGEGLEFEGNPRPLQLDRRRDDDRQEALPPDT